MTPTPKDIVPTPPSTTLSYDQSAQLTTDYTFRGRVKVACLKFASFIQAEATTTPAHSSRLRWAQQCYVQPDQVAGQVQNPVVLDPAVQSAGSGIDDASLQTATEDVIATFF